MLGLLAICAAIFVSWGVTLDPAHAAHGVHLRHAGFVGFLGMWSVMMAGMMLPSAGGAALVAAGDGAGAMRRLAAFLSGYLGLWAALGAGAWTLWRAVGAALDAAPGAARWIGAAIFLAAGAYQFTPWKEACIRHCRVTRRPCVPRGGAAAALRAGLAHGLHCAGCCGVLMATLLAVGMMNVPAMLALTAVVFAEKVSRRGIAVARAVGGILLVAALAAPFAPRLLPGLRPPAAAAADARCVAP